MIEPSATGAALLESLRPAPLGGVTVARLGQAGILLRFPTATVLIDPYLSNHCEAVLPRPFDHRRATRAPLDAAELEGIDLVLTTHDHLDHFDVPTLRSLRDASPASTLICPYACLELADHTDWTSTRVAGMDDDDTLWMHGLRITAFEVAHDEVEEVEGHARFLGFVIRSADLTVIHVGDARATTALEHTLGAWSPDLVFLPINGRSPERQEQGFAGNMSAAEAVELASSAGTGLVIPMHYDMFMQNTDDDALATFEQLAARANLGVRVAAVGETITVEGRSAE